MQAPSPRPFKTFSIGFAEAGYDEAPYAKAVATHLGTDHTELYLTPADAQAVIADLSHIYDEHFADSSQIPTILVRSEEHTSELQSLMRISYAVFCLKKTKTIATNKYKTQTLQNTT